MGVNTTEREFRHVPGLDGVRGVAVLLVVLFHYGKLWRVDTGGLLPAGYIGVDIFFVLSGFLITSLLLNERAANDRVSIRRFYVRRGLRLLPALDAGVIGMLNKPVRQARLVGRPPGQ